MRVTFGLISLSAQLLVVVMMGPWGHASRLTAHRPRDADYHRRVGQQQQQREAAPADTARGAQRDATVVHLVV